MSAITSEQSAAAQPFSRETEELEEFRQVLGLWEDAMGTGGEGNTAVAPRMLREFIWAQQEKLGKPFSSNQEVQASFRLDHWHTASKGNQPLLSTEDVADLLPEVLERMNELMGIGAVSRSFYIDGVNIVTRTQIAYGVEVDGVLENPDKWVATDIGDGTYWLPNFRLFPKQENGKLVPVVNKAPMTKSNLKRDPCPPKVLLCPLNLEGLDHKKRMDALLDNLTAANLAAPMEQDLSQAQKEIIASDATGASIAFAEPAITRTLPAAEILPPLRRPFRELVSHNLGAIAAFAAVPLHLLKR